MLALAGSLVLAGSAAARTLLVPDEHPTIAAALEAAQDGDVVLLGPGTFSEALTHDRFPLVLAGRSVTIRGAGAWRTILDASGEARHFHCIAGDSSTIESVTLRGGWSADPGGAVRVEDAATRLCRLVIEECASETEGSAIALLRARGTVTNVLFAGNGDGEPAVIVSGGAPRVEWCTFEGASAEAIRVRGARAEIGRNVIVGASPGGAGAATSKVDPDAGAFAGTDPLELPPNVSASASAAPSRALLGPAIPNPFTPSTMIQFTVTEATVVDLGVFNVLGQRIRTLFAGDRAPGEHREAWDGRDDEGRDMPPGVYYVRITQGRDTETQPLVLVR